MLSLKEIFQTDKEWQKSWRKELKGFWLGIVGEKPDKEDRRFLKEMEAGFKKQMEIKFDKIEEKDPIFAEGYPSAERIQKKEEREKSDKDDWL